MLSFPVSLSAWFWGKFLGRLMLVVAPIFAALIAADIEAELAKLA